VEAGVSTERRHALVWVHDSGIGIPSAEQPEIFSRFYRARNVSAYPGSGLGLAIVQAVAAAHGGTVGLHSDETGTRFEVRLPLA
jgi:signal transduction histidine kinase